MGNLQKQIEAVERDKMALELRRAGLKYDKIAERLGYRGPSGAHHAVKRGLQRTLQEPADELRQVEVDRLDVMWFAIYPDISKGSLMAINAGLRIMERRAALLGLDAPKRADITSKGESVKIREVIVELPAEVEDGPEIE